MDPSKFSQEPLVRIVPPRPWPRIGLRELWDYRDLVVVLGVRDLRLRYRQTALGVLWILIQPVLAAGVFTFVFSGVAGLPSDGGVPYFLTAYVGMLGWNLFSSTMNRAGISLVTHPQLVSKVYFARLALPTSVVVTTLLDLGVGASILVVLLPATGTAPSVGLTLMPIWVLALLGLALGVGLIAGAAAVRYRDVTSVLSLATQLLLYLSPVAYSSALVPGAYERFFFLNPLATLLDAFRWSLLGTPAPSGARIAYAMTIAALVLVAGLYTFKRLERSFADVI
jgi:lipopolysaccharide transport system permease protein